MYPRGPQILLAKCLQPVLLLFGFNKLLDIFDKPRREQLRKCV